VRAGAVVFGVVMVLLVAKAVARPVVRMRAVARKVAVAQGWLQQ
jgi:hypothetical protein